MKNTPEENKIANDTRKILLAALVGTDDLLLRDNQVKFLIALIDAYFHGMMD